MKNSPPSLHVIGQETLTAHFINHQFEDKSFQDRMYYVQYKMQKTFEVWIFTIKQSSFRVICLKLKNKL